MVRLGRLAVAVAILGYLSVQVPFTAVLEAARAASAAPLVGAVLVTLAGQLMIADRVQRLAAGIGLVLGTVRLFAINLAARFYGLFLPAGNVTGTVIRYYSLAREEKDYVAVALALVLDRLIATVTLCAVGVGFWLLAMPEASWPALIAMAVGFATLCLPLLAVVAPSGLVDAVARRSPVRWPRKLVAVRGQIRRLRALPRSTVAFVVIAGVIVHLLGALAYALIALGLGLDLHYVDLVWIRSAALLAAILPVSVAGLGLREGTLVVLLGQAGVATAHGLTFALVVFVVTVLGVGLIGGAIEAQRFIVMGVRARPHQPG